MDTIRPSTKTDAQAPPGRIQPGHYLLNISNSGGPQYPAHTHSHSHNGQDNLN